MPNIERDKAHLMRKALVAEANFLSASNDATDIYQANKLRDVSETISTPVLARLHDLIERHETRGAALQELLAHAS